METEPSVKHANKTSDSQSLIRLMTWLSPAFPIGAFAYSSGLESAYQENLITDKKSLLAWLDDILKQGAAWNDAVLCAAAWRGDEPLDELAALGAALANGKERWLETTAQGDAFLKAAKPWLTEQTPSNTFNAHALTGAPCPLPVAVGAVAKAAAAPLLWTLTAYLHAYASNQVQAALRLGRIGQDAGVEILAALEAIIETTAKRAAASTTDDLGTASVFPDLLSIRHEQLEPRIFRS